MPLRPSSVAVSPAGAPPKSDHWLLLPFLLLALAIVVLTGKGIADSVAHQQDLAVARLQAIADLKVRQIDDWLQERRSDAEFLQSSIFFAEQYRRWRAGDRASGQTLQSRLTQFGRSRHFAAALLLDARGERLWGSSAAPPGIAPQLQAAARQALASGTAQRLGPYRDASGKVVLDFIVPVTAGGSSPTPLIVLQANLADWLFATLQTWPVPSASAETLVFRRDGDDVLYLNELRHRPDTAVKLRLPVAAGELLAAQVLRGEVGQGAVVSGLDYRGAPAIGVVRGIPGSDWLLIAKVDLRELHAAVVHDALWLGVVGGLALLMVGAGAFLLRQRQALSIAAHVQQSQAGHLRVLQLLDAIAETSSDAIFAKDTAGRYLLFNRAAARISGQPAAAVLGRDGHGLFSSAPLAALFDGAGGPAATFPATLHTAVGEMAFLVTTGPLHDADGQNIGSFGILRDITPFKQSEAALQLGNQALRLSEERLQLALDAAKDGLWDWDAQHGIAYLSPQYYEITGYPPGEEAPALAAIRGLLHADDLPRVLATVAAAMHGERSSGEIECRILTRSGAVKWIAAKGRVVDRDADGRASRMVGTIADITERKQADEVLHMLSQAVEQSPESIIITDLAAKIEYVNAAFQRVSGYEAGEVLGQNCRILQSGKTPAGAYAEMWAALSRGELWEGEFINRRKNGEIYTEFARIAPVRLSDGRISHYLAIKEDITERKRAAEAIRESKALLQCVIDSTPDWIYVKDSEHRLMLVNRSFAQAFEQQPEEMVGRCDTDFLPLDLCADADARAASALHEGEAELLSGEFVRNPHDRVCFGNGEVRVFDTLHGPLRDPLQRVYGYLTYRRDISERYRTEQEQRVLEKQLRQAQKMELIGHLTGGIAHDFNNILAAMFGYAELAQMSPALQQHPELGLYLQEILQAGIRAKELVSQLLTFSHKKEAVSEPIMVAPIVNEVSKLLRSTMPATISISTSVVRNLPAALISSVHLHQVLMNLGINARDAIAGKGSVAIGAEPRSFAGHKTCDSCHQSFAGDYLLISVQDSGAGIAPEHLQKIFDPFFTTKEVGGGSGLGLSVLHGIVHSANGHIEVLTALGRGTEFRIYLPAQSRLSRRPPREPKADARHGQARGHVLVVDDEESIVGFMTTLLENFGCTVTGLTSASEALRLLQHDPHAVDLVITDQTMPDMTGVELSRAMLALRPGLPIVLSTGYSNAIDEEAALRLGVRRFLVKPVPAKVLCAVVVECLAEKPPTRIV
jgi:PAS domain S-box-containing protein